MYTVYCKHRGMKRATKDGFYTDNLERAKEVARREKASWWGQHGVYEWIKVKDVEKGKYIWEA